MHHKQQLISLQQAKKNFLEKSANVSKEAEALMKLKEKMLKKHLTQYSSKVRIVYFL